MINQIMEIAGILLDFDGALVIAVPAAFQSKSQRNPEDSEIVNDPNAWSADPRYVLNLVKRVVRVSVETLRIVAELARLSFNEKSSEVKMWDKLH